MQSTHPTVSIKIIAGSMLPRCNFAVTFLFLRWKTEINEETAENSGGTTNQERRKIQLSAEKKRSNDRITTC